MIRWFFKVLTERWFLVSLIIINFLGSIYGFYWYKNQLIATEPSFLRLFVPDSPTSSSLFTIVLILLLLGKRFPSLEAFAAVTNFKYGIWAVLMILLGAAKGNPLQWTDYMLMISHGGMAAESLLYSRFYSIRLVHLLPVAVWTLLNDLLDYTLNIHPWLPAVLADYDNAIGWFTFGLSLFSIMLVYQLVRVSEYTPAKKKV
ncbi:MAG: DUF1405 domain-containing protein [Bacillaceae bacterium]|nr:DUF1405 domain-containing protein [Bacillaceae bacterium]